MSVGPCISGMVLPATGCYSNRKQNYWDLKNPYRRTTKQSIRLVYGPWETNVKTNILSPALNVEPHLGPCLSLHQQAGQSGPWAGLLQLSWRLGPRWSGLGSYRQ